MTRLSPWLIALIVVSLGLAHSITFAAEPTPGAAVSESSDTEGIAPVQVPQPSPLATRRYHSGNVLWVVSTIWGLVVPAAIFFTGFSASLRNIATRIQRRWYFSLVIYLVLILLVLFFLSLPLDYYSDFFRPHAYGLSSQTFAKWLNDEVLSLVLAIIGSLLVLWIPFLLLRRAPKRWWLYTWFASIPILVFISFVEPIWVEPLFNHFGPMHDKALEARILDLARRTGIDGADVYEVDKSVDTNELNAYVTGIGGTKRIIVWDTTLKALTPNEVTMVMSHEMGHYALGHVWKSLLYESAALLIGLWCLHISIGWILQRFGARSGVHELGDMALLPLIMLIFSVVIFVLMPPLLAVSRDYEHEADRFGLELTHGNHACAMVFVQFAEHDLAYPSPSPLIEFFRASHPSIRDRIEFCNDYHPWLQGDDGRYSSYFKQ